MNGVRGGGERQEKAAAQWQPDNENLAAHGANRDGIDVSNGCQLLCASCMCLHSRWGAFLFDAPQPGLRTEFS